MAKKPDARIFTAPMVPGEVHLIGPGLAVDHVLECYSIGRQVIREYGTIKAAVEAMKQLENK